LEEETGAIIGARTVVGAAAECLLVGNEIVIGIVDMRTDGGRVSIRVSANSKDYQRARVYEDDKLIESLLFRDGSVVYVDEAANPPANMGGSAVLRT
jgi:hypothetical protein